MCRTTSVLVMILAIWAPPLAAQAIHSSAGEIVAGLRSGQEVRLRPAGEARLVGRVSWAGSDSLLLSRSGRDVAFDPAAIDSLWTRGHATAWGALIGAGVGLVGSVAISSAVCSSIEEGFMCGESGTAVASSTVAAAALGAAIGWAIRPWRLRYARGVSVAVRVGSDHLGTDGRPEPFAAMALEIHLP